MGIFMSRLFQSNWTKTKRNHWRWKTKFTSSANGLISNILPALQNYARRVVFLLLLLHFDGCVEKFVLNCTTTITAYIVYKLYTHLRWKKNGMKTTSTRERERETTWKKKNLLRHWRKPSRGDETWNPFPTECKYRIIPSKTWSSWWEQRHLGDFILCVFSHSSHTNTHTQHISLPNFFSFPFPTFSTFSNWEFLGGGDWDVGTTICWAQRNKNRMTEHNNNKKIEREITSTLGLGSCE